MTTTTRSPSSSHIAVDVQNARMPRDDNGERLKNKELKSKELKSKRLESERQHKQETAKMRNNKGAK